MRPSTAPGMRLTETFGMGSLSATAITSRQAGKVCGSNHKHRVFMVSGRVESLAEAASCCSNRRRGKEEEEEGVFKLQVARPLRSHTD